MSKRYEFHSKLSPEEIYTRLRAYAKPGGASWSGDGTFRYQQEQGCFWLTYTGNWPATGFIPFRARVKKKNSGSLISGGFFLWRCFGRIFLILGLIVFILMQFTGVSAVVGLIMIVLWLLMCAGLIFGVNAILFKERRQTVLEFIQQHLLE